MSKDLERDYKELMTENAPDLWERIEGQLGPQKAGAKRGRRKRYGVFGMAAAACLCLAVTVSALTGKDATERKSDAGAGTKQGDMAADAEADSWYREPAEENGTMEPKIEAALESRPQNCTITAAVTDILRQENGTVYLVRVVETAAEGVEKEDILRFLDPGVLETELALGGTYEFDVFLPEEGNGEEVWTICGCEEKSKEKE